MIGVPRRAEGKLNPATSAAILDLDATFYGHHRTPATTYGNGKIAVCVLQSILTAEEDVFFQDASPLDDSGEASS